ncbi:MAG: hypothetical protein U0T36_03240 [Saprospiraceae bacterium]
MQQVLSSSPSNLYNINDWVEVKEKFGRVQDIQIFNTVVVTPLQQNINYSKMVKS